VRHLRERWGEDDTEREGGEESGSAVGHTRLL
jgi:hypothetical protein